MKEKTRKTNDSLTDWQRSQEIIDEIIGLHEEAGAE